MQLLFLLALEEEPASEDQCHNENDTATEEPWVGEDAAGRRDDRTWTNRGLLEGGGDLDGAVRRSGRSDRSHQPEL